MAARDIILISVVLFSFALIFFVTHFIINTATDQMINNEYINQSQNTTTALEGVRNVTDRYDYVMFGVFLALSIGIIVTGYFIGGEPVFMFIYFTVIVIGVTASTIFANIWEDVSQNAVIFGSTVASFPMTNNIVSYLPFYVAVIGFMSIVAMFVKPLLSRGR